MLNPVSLIKNQLHLALGTVLICASPIFAQLAADEVKQKAICTGAIPNESGGHSWGPLAHGNCPDNWAIIANNVPVGISRYARGEKIQIQATCCPLASNDILLPEHKNVGAKCPENFIATGLELVCPDGDNYYDRVDKCTSNLRCTKINTDKYKLGAHSPALYWGSGSTFWKHELRILTHLVPQVFRLALGRQEQFHWHQNGCVGYPFGSLLSGKDGKRCSDISYRSLLTLDNKLVNNLPSCKSVKDPYSLNPECVND